MTPDPGKMMIDAGFRRRRSWHVVLEDRAHHPLPSILNSFPTYNFKS
jgi:hypothetical protein